MIVLLIGKELSLDKLIVLGPAECDRVVRLVIEIVIEDDFHWSTVNVRRDGEEVLLEEDDGLLRSLKLIL